MHRGKDGKMTDLQNQTDRDYKDYELLIETLSQLSALHQKMDSMKEEMNTLKFKTEENEDRFVLIDKNLVLMTSITKHLEEKIKDTEPMQKAFAHAQGIGWFITKLLFYAGGTIAGIVGLKEIYEFMSKFQK